MITEGIAAPGAPRLLLSRQRAAASTSGRAAVLLPTLALYLIPVLLGIEYRFRFETFSFTLAEISIPLTCAIAALMMSLRCSVAVSRTDYALLFVIAAAASPSVFFQSDIRHAFSVYRDFIGPLVFFIAFLTIRINLKQTLALAKAFVLFAALSGLLGIAQYVTGNFMWFQESTDAVGQLYKTKFIQSSALGNILHVNNALALGLYSGVNNYAAYLVIPGLVAVALSKMASLRLRERLFWKACWMVILAALVLTFSRGSLLTFLMGRLMLTRVFRNYRTQLKTLLLAIAVGGSISGVLIWQGVMSWDQWGTLAGRADMARSALALVVDHPLAMLTGGFTEAYFSDYCQVQLVHNLPLYMLLQFGIVALITWFWLVVGQLGWLVQATRSGQRDIKVLALALFGGVTATVFIYGQTASVVDMVQASLGLFFWIGIGKHLYNSRTEAGLRYVR